MIKIWRKLFYSGFLIFITPLFFSFSMNKPSVKLEDYRTELKRFRAEFGSNVTMPNIKFFMFGMGNRLKMIYKHGLLINSLTGDTLKKYDVADELIIPPEYTVYLKLKNGRTVIIRENEEGVWVVEGKSPKRIQGTEIPVLLPDFKTYSYPSIMKVLHHEILINILDSNPLPNYLVYDNPWRRDAAMMAMCLKATKNLGLIKDWVLSLNDPYDHNNNGEAEADNLGQTLYLLSFFTNKEHPLVSEIISEVNKCVVNTGQKKYIAGRTDFHVTPCYQTKWLKYGLRAIGLPDDYSIPEIYDNYSALFWWDFKDAYVNGNKDVGKNDRYPYLDWASNHFHEKKSGVISNNDYPLTWETLASEADYNGMVLIDTIFVNKKTSMPHTWHASEVFLYLLEIKRQRS